jgi:phosphatidylinositol glycan class C protein
LQFAHILFCLELYLLFPFMRRYIRQASIMWHVVLTVVMVSMSLLLLWPLSQWLAALFFSAVLAISFVCPRWLVGIHKFKAKINGPWDEAVPLLGTSVNMQLQQRQSDRGQVLQQAPIDGSTGVLRS